MNFKRNCKGTVGWLHQDILHLLQAEIVEYLSKEKYFEQTF
jgi:hypothetical protein